MFFCWRLFFYVGSCRGDGFGRFESANLARSNTCSQWKHRRALCVHVKCWLGPRLLGKFMLKIKKKRLCTHRHIYIYILQKYFLFVTLSCDTHCPGTTPLQLSQEWSNRCAQAQEFWLKMHVPVSLEYQQISFIFYESLPWLCGNVAQLIKNLWWRHLGPSQAILAYVGSNLLALCCVRCPGGSGGVRSKASGEWGPFEGERSWNQCDSADPKGVRASPA